jgi:hypothetical protein
MSDSRDAAVEKMKAKLDAPCQETIASPHSTFPVFMCPHSVRWRVAFAGRIR